MSKGAGSQTQTTTPDALTQEMRRQIWYAGQAAAGMPLSTGAGTGVGANNGVGGAISGVMGGSRAGAPMMQQSGGPGQAQPVPGIDPLTGQAIDSYQRAMGAGNLGMGALSGDAAAYQQLANPYQQNVVNAAMQNFGQLRDQTMMGVNDAATRAGAFGGSRHGVAEGVALGDINRSAQSELAGLQQQGYNDTMNRAGGLANLGMGAAGQLNQLGEYRRQVAMQQDPAMRRLQILQQAAGMMPGGGSTTAIPMTRNVGAGILGGAATGSALGPWGMLAGGILGAI